MQAYFTDDKGETRYFKAQLQHSFLPDVMFDVTLITVDALKLEVSLPLATNIDPAVLIKCAKFSGDEDCFFHPDTGDVLYLVHEGCEPDECVTLEHLIALRTPGKALECEVHPDKVTLF
jgi:hypothetical protein